MIHLHAALGFTTKSTILKAIWNKLILSWTSITANVVNDFLQSQKRPRRGILSIKDRESSQQNQITHMMINYNMKMWIQILPHPLTENKMKCIVKFGTRKKQYKLINLEISL